jgi:hypothetical protein
VVAFNDAGYDVRMPWHVLDAATIRLRCLKRLSTAMRC